ncbi:MAG TPA: KOW motif-containing protein [Chloroflexia bacterium]|nr:KOW motif-containing protein [Chloroflexia bacterium]
MNQSDDETEWLSPAAEVPVEVISGPFEGFAGVISKVNPAKGKVLVRISFFGRETPSVLDFDQVRTLDPGDGTTED